MSDVPLQTAPLEPSTDVAPAGAAIEGPPRRPEWDSLERFGLRFVFVYVFLLVPSFPLDLLPILRPVVAAYDRLWFLVVPWVGRGIGLGEIIPGLPGDSIYHLVKTLCLIVVSALAALAWSGLRTRPGQDAVLRDWLSVAMRYYLATAMFNYGVVKVFNTQFGSLGPERLIRRYGDSTPAELLWAYMGHSNVYTTFCGLGEVLGAVLLFFRRTTTLGALLLAVLLANVVMLNFCYGVGVKLYSTHLFVMSLFLVAADLPRLVDVLVLNRPTVPASPRPPLPHRWMAFARLAAKTTFVGMVVVFMTGGALSLFFFERVAVSPLYGLYEVDTFTRNGATLAPLVTDARRWRWFVVGKYRRLTVETMSGFREVFCVQDDATTRTLNVLDCRSQEPLGALIYVEPAPDRLSVSGALRNDRLSLELRRVDESTFRLVNPDLQRIEGSTR
jgi:hypothetical protein